MRFLNPAAASPLEAMSPLRSLFLRWSGFAAAPVASSAMRTRPLEVAATPSTASVATSARRAAVGRSFHRPARPLRVVRVVEAGASAAHGGRMRISGRMADVCAELDRMAEREAA